MFSKETQALMEAAVDSIIVIDHRGVMTAVNDATCRLFGYRTDELLGENVNKLMTEPDRRAHDAYIHSYIATGRARIIGVGREVTALHKDATPIPVHLSVGRIAGSDPPRFVGILRDVRDVHEAFDALKLERDRANAYLELHESILLMIDTERRIVEINAQGAEILGGSSTELHGRDWLSIMRGAAERERALLMLQSSLSSSKARGCAFDCVGVSGASRRIHWRCIARRTSDGAPAGWLCSGQDVTEEARRSEESAMAQQRLTRVARLATMGEMAAGVAHELNQPLTAISTYARACERFLDMPEPDFAELREAVREIGSEGLRAGDIIRRLRRMVGTRVDHEDRQPTDVNALIEEVRPLLNADARVHDAQLEIATTPNLPRVEADAVQLQQVVLNLARNAFEALESVAPGARRVEIVTVRSVGGDIEIRVSDNGPGVSAAMSGRLFEPFNTTKPNGTGLGLAISRTIVQAHKGSITTRPVEPHGCSFIIRLPALKEN